MLESRVQKRGRMEKSQEDIGLDKIHKAKHFFISVFLCKKLRWVLLLAFRITKKHNLNSGRAFWLVYFWIFNIYLGDIFKMPCLNQFCYFSAHLVQLYMTVRFRNTIHSYGRGSFNLSVKAIQALIGQENPHQPPNQSDAKLNLWMICSFPFPSLQTVSLECSWRYVL